MRRFLKERCVPDAAAQWVYDAAQWAYDGRVVANARRDVLAHPGLGEERINDAARIVVSAIGAGRSQRDPRMALSGVFENPSLTREAIDSAMRVASLLPDFIVNSMLRGGALTGDDVRALWGSRSENRSYMGLGRDFVEPAVCGGSAPNSLVEEWLNRDEYAPHAAAYAADVSEDDVLRIVHSVDNPLRDRALINPVLSSEALWSEMRQRRVLGDGLTYVFANESAHPSLHSLSRAAASSIAGCALSLASTRRGGRVLLVTPWRRAQRSRRYCSPAATTSCACYRSPGVILVFRPPSCGTCTACST